MGTETMEQEQETATPEQTAQSIEDRLAEEYEQADGAPLKQRAAKQPDNDQDASPDAKSEEGDGLEEVEYEGETFQVPAKLKEAIIHKADYTRKTQEVAEKQRNIELQAEQIRVHQLEREFEQTISEPLNNLNLIESRTKLLLANWSTLTADEKQEITYLDKQKEQIVREIEGKKNEFANGLKKSREELRSKLVETVSKAIPNWSPALAKEITEHAINDGYSNQELSSITDPRMLKTLWKAREYDRLKTKAVATPAKATPAVKPGPSNPMPAQVKDKLAFQKQMKTASTATQKARLIEERFAKQFGG
jgi:hypothetical protein